MDLNKRLIFGIYRHLRQLKGDKDSPQIGISSGLVGDVVGGHYIFVDSGVHVEHLRIQFNGDVVELWWFENNTWKAQLTIPLSNPDLVDMISKVAFADRGNSTTDISLSSLKNTLKQLERTAEDHDIHTSKYKHSRPVMGS